MKSQSFNSNCKECGKLYIIDFKGISTKCANYICTECGTKNVLSNPKHGQQEQLEAGIGRNAKVSWWKRSGGGLSIRSKLTMVIIVLLLVAISAVGLMASSKSRNALSQQAEVHLLRNTQQKADEYGLIFDRIKDEALGIAKFAGSTFQRNDIRTELDMAVLMPWTGKGYGNPGLEKRFKKETMTLQRIGIVINSVTSQNPYLSLGYMATEGGVMVIADEGAHRAISGLTAYIPTKRSWYVAAKEQGKTIWTEPYIDANTKDLVITCATPVYTANKQLLGIVGFDVLLDTIQKDVLNLDIGYNSYAFLVDEKGKALVHPAMNKKDTRWNQSYNAKNLLQTANTGFNSIVRSMVGYQSGVDSYESSDGSKYVSYAPLKAIKSSLAIVASKDEVVRPAVAIRNIILVVWAVVLVIAILAGFIVGNGITKPINELTRAADLISQGKMDLDVLPEDRKDEIGKLTQAFNRLVTSLRLAMMQKSVT